MKLIKNILITAVAMIAVFAIYTVSYAAGIQICYDGATHLYTGSVYSLKVNGNYISSPMEPIIFNDHALVPVREIFEECGATVDYDGDTRCVEIYYGDKYIKMYINNNMAFVNGQRTIIPDNIVPKLIYKPGGLTKTMVPVRFISEAAGMDVEFDAENGEILIWSEEAFEEEEVQVTEPVTVNSIDYTKLSENSIKVSVSCSGDVGSNLSYFTLKNPQRVVVDFKGMNYSGGDRNVSLGLDGIKSIRTGVDSQRTRIVIDVDELKSYNVEQTENNVVEITVKAQKTSSSTGSVSEIINNASSAVDNGYASGITKATAADKKKVIMLDAGHGGSDPGAIGRLDGEEIYEKTLTLSITYKVKAILEENGYKTSMTRTTDTLPSLAERPAQANEEGCALFVSIHINSAEATEAYGSEVYWSEENNGDEYNVTSKTLATNILDSMIKYMDSYNRGVRMANWAVIRRSQMPAVLVEVGFISNEDELAKMCSDDYQNKTALGIAEGIIKTLKKVKMPE